MYIFSAITPGQPGRLQNQFWIEDGVIAGMIEKIWLSGEERLFWRSSKSAYSHSMVLGGFELISYTTLLIPFTSLVIRLEIRSSTP